ncbi:alpha/beta fold hydrolase [Actinomadura oligospora]|uniref:alpha/beta fold hydrolase n=1 Tax=Actinomadura oligospora TaxID=111804 RepID=UPI000479FBA3|nr:alpha/beta fold hydrolase [Actinomadura oligospora]
MIDVPVQYFPARDGVRLAFRELGEGRPLVLIHGYFSTATVNWIRYGHAEALADLGYRVIMPDLRGHGDSGKPHDPANYPPDVLADDGFDLLEHLDLTDYVLGGYSLGARTTTRMLARGATPVRAILGGMGLAGITTTEGRGDHFRNVLSNPGTFERGTAEWRAEAFLKTVGGDRTALLRVLDTFVNTPREDLATMTLPTLVVAGADDHDNGSAKDLATALPNGRYAEIPGNHMSAVTRKELAGAIVEFLEG